jgi:xyloglucan 6-xylosyltransferase
MYGNPEELYDKRSYTSINTGSFLIRNCQWSIDLLDRWASFGATEELRVKNEDLLNNFLSDRPSGWTADDQCVLAYVLISEREKWESRVHLVDEFAMSGHWAFWVPRFPNDVEWTDEYTVPPFVTHFAGCHPCSLTVTQEVIDGMHKTYNYADNQVLRRYGLRHLNVNSSEIIRTSPLPSKIQVEEAVDEQTLSGELSETKDALEVAANGPAARGVTKVDSASKKRRRG